MTHSPAKLVDLRAKSSVLIYSQSVDEQSTPSGTRFANPTHEQQSSSGRELSSGRLESERLVQLLSAVPLLQSLAPDELSALAEGLKVYNFDASAVIIQEGEPGETMFFLDTGEAHVEVNGAGVVGHYARSDFFGEAALLSDKPRVATVRAGRLGSRCVALGRAELQNLAKSNPAVSQKLQLYQHAHVRHPVWHAEGRESIESAWAEEIQDQQQGPAFEMEHEEGREGGAVEFEEPKHNGFSDRFTAFAGPGNIAAGFASALHVNLYLAALGMMLATNYFDVMGMTMVAVFGTAMMQAIHTLNGSYRHFVISNADTVPGAVMVEIIQLIVTQCELEWELSHAYQLQNYVAAHPDDEP